MNKLDIFTIIVVFLCVLAIVFLLWRATGLFGGDRPEPADQTTDRIERPVEPRRPLDDNVDGNADSDLLDDNTIGRPGNRVVDAVDATTDRIGDALSGKEEADVRREDRELEIPASYNNRPGRYMVMGGAFSVRDNAVTQERTLERAGFNDAEVTRFNGGRYAVVLVDRFESLADARAEVARVRSYVPDAYIMRKR